MKLSIFLFKVWIIKTDKHLFIQCKFIYTYKLLKLIIFGIIKIISNRSQLVCTFIYLPNIVI